MNSLMPNQHVAPIRLVVPWKYGFKSIKSIVRVEFTSEPPATFWNTRWFPRNTVLRPMWTPPVGPQGSDG